MLWVDKGERKVIVSSSPVRYKEKIKNNLLAS